MDIRELINQAESIVRKNSPQILSGLAVSGTITTAFLASKATWKSVHKILSYEKEENVDLSKKEQAKLVWKSYIPAGVTGLVTIGCIVGAAKINNSRTSALTAAYSLSERALSEYKNKVVETIGERKEQKVRDDIAQDKVRANPPSNTVVLEGTTGVLVCELFTGRYFRSDMETLKKAQNALNSRVLNHMYATMSEFYSLLEWPHTSESSNMGWDSDRLMELEFSTVFGPNDIPCIAFEYNYTKPL